MKTRVGISNILWTIIFILICIIWLFPIVFAIGTSFRPLQDVYNNVLNIVPLNPTFSNYLTLFDRLPMLKIIMNTFTIATTVTVGKMVISFLAAYVFVYFDFKNKRKSK